MLWTKWIGVLQFIYKHDKVDFKSQKIYKSYQFTKIMRELITIGWVEEQKTVCNGFIVKKEYVLTQEGFLLTKYVFNLIK